MGACVSYGPNHVSTREIKWPSDDESNAKTQSIVEEKKSNNDILKVMSWNIAGINNNPWEYYVCLDDKKYNDLMFYIESFLTNNGNEIKVRSVLDSIDSDFFKKLQTLLGDKCNDFDSLINDNVSQYLDLSIPDFLSNKFIGENRLISWPDRLLNTIDNDNGTYLYRPTVINYYQKTFESVSKWFSLWITFMDEIGINILSKNVDNKYAKKYDGDNINFLLLNIIFLAIFDAILIFILFDIQSKHNIDWQKIKSNLYQILNKNKINRTVQIMNVQYADYDILFLQEVRNNLLDDVKQNNELKSFADKYHIIYPKKLSKNNQTSIICLKKSRFDATKVLDVSNEYYTEINSKLIGDGDLLVINISDFILISFHGDSGGMASSDVIKGIAKMQQMEKYKTQKFVIGIDANTHCDNVADGKKKYSVNAFNALLNELDFNDCFDGNLPTKHTVNSARTYLQPQLNKAVKKEDIIKENVDFRAPKDYIVFGKNQFDVKKEFTIIDNKGNGKYDGNFEYVFPSSQFPSDHAIISAHLKIK